MRLAARGYGYYLPLKIGKALLAVPCFVLWISTLVALGLVVRAWEAAIEVAVLTQEFWARPWLRGFSRAYYKSLTHYREAVLVPRKKDAGLAESQE